MKGIRIALPGKDTIKSKPKDLIMDTSLISLPISKAMAFDVTIPIGTLSSPSIISVVHGKDYPPLFRAWIQEINTIDFPTTNWYALPELKPLPCRTGGDGSGSGSGYVIDVNALSRPKTVDISIAGGSSGTGTYPPNEIKLRGFIYIFDSRWQEWPYA